MVKCFLRLLPFFVSIFSILSAEDNSQAAVNSRLSAIEAQLTSQQELLLQLQQRLEKLESVEEWFVQPPPTHLNKSPNP